MQSRPEAPQQVASKTVKLRESCDSCLIAKVKCSKARPLCARCLANGASCGYSVSARAGRKNRNSGINKPSVSPNSHRKTTETAANTKSTNMNSSAMFSILDSEAQVGSKRSPDPLRTTTPPLSLEDQQHEMAMAMEKIDTTPIEQKEFVDTGNLLPSPPFNGDFTNAFLPVPTPESFAEFSANIPGNESTSHHLAESPTWIPNNSFPNFTPYQSPLDMFTAAHPLGPDPTPPSASHPQGQRTPELEHVSYSPKRPCDCFATCIEVLQTLHQHSWMASSPMQDGIPFDIVLTINREAIDACSTMLNCSECVSKSGSSIATMLLSTIFGKIMSLYRAACLLRFGSSTMSPVSTQLAFGAYTVTGEDRQLLEIEILLLELRKVENIFKTFQDKVSGGSDEKDEASVYIALVAYLDKNLRYIFDFLRSHRSNSM